MAHCAIGLDIGSSSLRAAQVSFGKSGAVLDRIGEASFPDGAVVDGVVVDGAVVAAALRQLWRTHRFSSKDVHLGVANQRVVVREVTLPDMPAKDLALALPYLVQDVLPVPVDSAVLDFHPLEQLPSEGGAAQVRGLLVAATRDMVLANIAAVQAAGLRVASIDLAPFAVLRAVGSRWGDDEGLEALVDIGARITSLVVHRDGVPAFVRVLLSGGSDITDGVVELSGVSEQEAERYKVLVGLYGTVDSSAGFSATPEVLAGALDDAVAGFVREIRTTLDYYSASHAGRAAERIVITGASALLPGLADRMSEDLHLPVTVGDPSAHLRGGHPGEGAHHALATSPASAVPVGLALGAAL